MLLRNTFRHLRLLAFTTIDIRKMAEPASGRRDCGGRGVGEALSQYTKAK